MMRSTRLSRQIFASLSQNDLAELTSQRGLGLTGKLESQVEDICTSRLKREVEELAGKNLDCETATRTIRSTEMEIVELEKRLSEESVQNRAARERLLQELAATRSKLASQKRRLAELETQLGLLQTSSAEIKVRVEAKNAVVSKLAAQVAQSSTLTQSATTDNQFQATQRQTLLQSKEETARNLLQSNGSLNSALKAVQGGQESLKSKLADKKTMEECLRQLAAVNQQLRAQTKKASLETRAVEQRITEFEGQLAETQREKQAREVECQQLQSEGQLVTKLIKKKLSGLKQTEDRVRHLSATIENTRGSVQEKENQLREMHRLFESKETTANQLREDASRMAGRRIALHVLGQSILGEMQGQVRSDISIRNLLVESESLYSS